MAACDVITKVMLHFTIGFEPMLLAPTDLARVAGRYHNDEVPVTYRVTAVVGGLSVVAEDRPDTNLSFVPAYLNAYTAGGTVLRPVVGADGRVTGIRVSDDRVWNLELHRLP